MKKQNLLRASTTALAVIVINSSIIFAISCQHETDIFGKWLASQQIYHDRSVADLCNESSDTFLNRFKERYQKNLVQLKGLVPLLSVLTNGSIHSDGFQLRSPLDEAMGNNLAFLYDQIQNNMPGFIDCLINNGMALPEINQEELANHCDVTIEKYKAFGRLLFAQSDSFKENEYLLAFANRLFEYCFYSATFSHYKNILTTHSYHPVARFINASLWYYLVGDGWMHWHKNPLDALKKKADEGHEIVYVAGGADFYHLLRNGIYNITIIDPFYPTQARYYSEGWEFLISQDSLNHEIRFGPSCNSIKMKCTEYKTGEPFYAKLSNDKIISFKKSMITWNVYDRDNNQIGHVTILRRPVTQDDFKVLPKTSLIMSYDELTFIAMPDMLNGWGVDPTLIDDNLEIHVKQLARPIKKDVLCNIRIASLLNLSDLRFINLASDPT